MGRGKRPRPGGRNTRGPNMVCISPALERKREREREREKKKTLADNSEQKKKNEGGTHRRTRAET